VKNPALIRPKAGSPDMQEICCWQCDTVVGQTLPITLHPAIAERMTDAEQNESIAYHTLVRFPHGFLDCGDGFFAKRRGRVRGQIRHPSQRDALMPLEPYRLDGATSWGDLNLVPRRFVKGFQCPREDCHATNEVRFN